MLNTTKPSLIVVSLGGLVRQMRMEARWPHVLAMLRWYYGVYGDTNVQALFVMSDEGPVQYAGFPLGDVVRDMRKRGYYKEHEEELDQVEFSFGLRHIIGWEKLRTGFQWIAEMEGGLNGSGHLCVPQGAKFVPPTEWDEDLKGVDWYRTLVSIESGKSYLEKYEEFSGLSIALNNGGVGRLEKLQQKTQFPGCTTSNSTYKTDNNENEDETEGGDDESVRDMNGDHSLTNQLF